MSTKALVPLSTPDEEAKQNMFAVMTTRRNADGKSLGRRLSFVGGFAAGDVKKALKEADSTLKGKELSKKVNQILRGDVEMAKVWADMTIAHAYRTGFRPIVADLNKGETKLKLTFEKVGEGNLTKEDVMDNAKRMIASGELSKENLLKLIAEAEAKAETEENADATDV